MILMEAWLSTKYFRHIYYVTVVATYSFKKEWLTALLGYLNLNTFVQNIAN